MRKAAELAVLSLFALLLVPQPSFAQQDKPQEMGDVEFGVRFATGDVYGRPDLPFSLGLKTSQFNEYQDIRDGFYVRRFRVRFDNVLHTKNYFQLQSANSLYRDQSYLAAFGEYGKFRLQVRYDEIPHIYSNTTETLYSSTTPGAYVFPALVRQQLQSFVATPTTSLASLISTQVVPQLNLVTPQILRRGGTISFRYNLTSRLGAYASYFRESEKGNRPIGTLFNSSPSASATAGYGEELLEPISYFNNLVRVGLEYGAPMFVVQGGYTGSFFQNNIHTMTWDNPFNYNLVGITTPTNGAMSLYPDNHADYLNFAAGIDLAHFFHLTASINPGWLKQNEAFIPYTTNTAIITCGAAADLPCNTTSVLPVSNLGGNVQTLAMNYTVSTASWKNITFKANYRQYDYNDNTPINAYTPVQGDSAAPGAATPNTPYAFTTKDLEFDGIWFFARKSSIKAGYEGLWEDRTYRDVDHSLDNSFFVSGDWNPRRDLLLRVSYRHSDRTPDSYADDNVTDPTTGAFVPCDNTTDVSFTGDQRCHRRFDEAARLQNRGDALLEYTPWDRLTFSAFGGTLQNNYNIAGGTNSSTPLNFLTGAAATTAPYYLYGLQKDISYNYGFDVDYNVTSAFTLYAEYTREHYYQRMITRYRTPTTGAQTILTCNGCDTANNDWESTATDPIDNYSAGFDLNLNKKTYITAYYSLSAGKGNVDQNYLGNPAITGTALAPNPNAFLLTGTNAAVPYPETVDRYHEVGVVFKYKLTDRLTPKIEYRYQQWDNRDYQTSVMTPYMGCVSAAPPATPVPGCTNPILNSSTSPTPLPGAASPYYPGFVVGDPSAARYLFLGVDQPSYHAHIVTATIEYRF